MLKVVVSSDVEPGAPGTCVQDDPKTLTIISLDGALVPLELRPRTRTKYRPAGTAVAVRVVVDKPVSNCARSAAPEDEPASTTNDIGGSLVVPVAHVNVTVDPLRVEERFVGANGKAKLRTLDGDAQDPTRRSQPSAHGLEGKTVRRGVAVVKQVQGVGSAEIRVEPERGVTTAVVRTTSAMPITAW